MAPDSYSIVDTAAVEPTTKTIAIPLAIVLRAQASVTCEVMSTMSLNPRVETMNFIETIMLIYLTKKLIRDRQRPVMWSGLREDTDANRVFLR